MHACHGTSPEHLPGEGGDTLCAYSQQRPMGTNLSCCLGLIDKGQRKSTDRLLVLVPHERPHGIMRLLENIRMLQLRALKVRVIKNTVALVAHRTGGTKRASAQMLWHPWHPNSALLNCLQVETHPKMDNGPELCDREEQLEEGCQIFLQAVLPFCMGSL